VAVARTGPAEIARLCHALRLAIEQRDRVFDELEQANDRVLDLEKQLCHLGSVDHARRVGIRREMFVAWRLTGGGDRVHAKGAE